MSVHTSIPGYSPGIWEIDRSRSTVSFRSRLMFLFVTRGTFDDFEGTIRLADNPLKSSVKTVIRTASVNTGNPKRDGHLRGPGYLDADTHPSVTFTSTGVRTDGDDFAVDGHFTTRTSVRRMTLRVVPGGFTDEGGRQEVRFTTTTQVSNKEFGILKGRGSVNDRTDVVLDIVAVKRS